MKVNDLGTVLKRFAGLTVFVFFLALLFSLSGVMGFFWTFLLLSVLAIPLVLIESKPLTIGYAIVYWLAIFVLYVSPWYFPGIYDGISSQTAATDHAVGKILRSKSDTFEGISEDNSCRVLRAEHLKKFDEKRAKVISSNKSTAAKADDLNQIRVDSAAELLQIERACGPDNSIQNSPVLTASYWLNNTIDQR